MRSVPFRPMQSLRVFVAYPADTSRTDALFALAGFANELGIDGFTVTSATGAYRDARNELEVERALVFEFVGPYVLASAFATPNERETVLRFVARVQEFANRARIALKQSSVLVIGQPCAGVFLDSSFERERQRIVGEDSSCGVEPCEEGGAK